MSSKAKKGLAAAAAVAVLGAGGAAIAVATGGGDDDETEKAITGRALERASEAALEHTGGGRVSDTEVGDEESYYEVEVTREDGGQVDVQLDRDFQVAGSEDDDDTTEDGD
jgi:shikimate 5-dehydrogenase